MAYSSDEVGSDTMLVESNPNLNTSRNESIYKLMESNINPSTIGLESNINLVSSNQVQADGMTQIGLEPS